MKEYVVWEEVFNNGIDIAEKTVVEVWLPYNPKRKRIQLVFNLEDISNIVAHAILRPFKNETKGSFLVIDQTCTLTGFYSKSKFRV